MEKSALRHEIKQRLMQMSKEDRVVKSKRICERIIDADVFGKASVVMAYLHMPHEVDLTLLILHAWQQGKTVAIPKVSWEQRHMIPIEITSLETGIKTNGHGLRNPINGTPVPFDQIDLVVTPGLGFDKNGNRLGRGGAYYDNFFKHEKITAARWAVAFSQQIYEQMPHDENDVSVDAIVTEKELIMCNTL
jgi:5-formyltetrahydrofolate cyclo-ligase